MNYGYYPGCSMHSSGREYGESMHVILGKIGVSLDEINDWACCGASSAHYVNHLLSIALPARSLALAEEQGMKQIVAPCAACFARLATAHNSLKIDDKLKRKIADDILEKPNFTNNVQVLNILEFLTELTPKLKEQITKPLNSLKVACYYGCLLLRPLENNSFDDPEIPGSMEELVKLTGAEPINWNMATECCGAGLSLSRTPSVTRLGSSIIEDAANKGADAIIVGCPMCHTNLDLRQKTMSLSRQIPIYYITELLGLAMGASPSELGIPRHYIKATPIAKLEG